MIDVRTRPGPFSFEPNYGDRPPTKAEWVQILAYWDRADRVVGRIVRILGEHARSDAETEVIAALVRVVLDHGPGPLPSAFFRRRMNDAMVRVYRIQLRRQDRGQYPCGTEDDQADGFHPADPRGTPLDHMLDRERAEVLAKAVAAAPSRHREVAERVFLAGESVQSYARSQGVAQQTGYYHVKQALAYFRRRLKEVA